MTADIHKIIKHVWPEWKVLDTPIGKGAFGTVYKAVRSDMAGESYSAIKMTVIPRDSSELEELRAEGLTPDQTSTYLQRIVQDYTTEIKMMMSVKGYTNIVTIDDYQIIKARDEAVWCILIRMELLTPLTKHLASNPMDEKAILRLGIDLCTALDVCASKSIIHRDIKPENIFVNEQGVYKLGDFGVARNLEKITNGLSKKGTPNYMAPEVYKATIKDTDFKAANKVDIYSLGMVLYWLSNGSRLPFLSTGKQITSPDERKNAFARRINGDPLPPPQNVSAPLQQIILKACSYSPEDRYNSAREMCDALRNCSNGKSTEIVQTSEHADKKIPTAVQQTTHDKSPVNRTVLIAVLAAVVVFLLTVTAIIALSSGKDKNDSDRKHTAPVNTLTSSVPGDINGDHVVNLADLIRLNKYLAGWNVEVCQNRLDLNGDGQVNAADQQHLQDYLNGNTVTLR